MYIMAYESTSHPDDLRSIEAIQLIDKPSSPVAKPKDYQRPSGPHQFNPQYLANRRAFPAGLCLPRKKARPQAHQKRRLKCSCITHIIKCMRNTHITSILAGAL